MIKAKERPLESTSPQEKNSVAEPMKNVTVGEYKPGKKKTEFKSVGECNSGKKKQSSKAQENVMVGILKKK